MKHILKFPLAQTHQQTIDLPADAQIVACYQYHLPTKLDTLLISPCDGAIRTRFEEVPPAAPCGASLNPYSGKWNFEGFDDDSHIGRAINWIERIAVQPLENTL